MLAPLLHLHEAKIEHIHGPIGAEFHVDGALQTDFCVVAAGRAFAGVADEIFDGPIIDVDLHNLVSGWAGES